MFASPISNVQVDAPAGIASRRLPFTQPLVRTKLPGQLAVVIRVFAPVVTTPLVRVSVPLAVAFAATRVTPFALLIFRFP